MLPCKTRDGPAKSKVPRPSPAPDLANTHTTSHVANNRPRRPKIPNPMVTVCVRRDRDFESNHDTAVQCAIGLVVAHPTGRGRKTDVDPLSFQGDADVPRRGREWPNATSSTDMKKSELLRHHHCAERHTDRDGGSSFFEIESNFLLVAVQVPETVANDRQSSCPK